VHGRFDPKERAREKQGSRDADDEAVAKGAKSLLEIKQECGVFVFPHVRMSGRGSKPLE
jgi:hypothetical protein